MKSLKSFTSIAVGSLLISASSLLACEMPVDVHPTSCPNPINVGSGGVVPAAILGTTNVGWNSVDKINPLHDDVEREEKGIQMLAYDPEDPNGGFIKDTDGNVIIVQATRSSLEDVATPYGEQIDCGNEYSCTTNGPDGIMDLTLKFPTQSKKGKPGVADLLVGLNPGETRCVMIQAWTYPQEGDGAVQRLHGKDIIIVK